MRCLQTVGLAALLLVGSTAHAQQPQPAAESAPSSWVPRQADIDMVLSTMEKHPELAKEFMPLLLPGGPNVPEEWACIGCHETQVDLGDWKASLHRDRSVTCLHCHPEAAGVPHEADDVSSVHCGTCHVSTGTIMAAAEGSAHGPHAPGAENGCCGCHDPHTMGAEGASAPAMTAAGCLECHDSGDDLAEKHSDFLCAADLHLAKVGCQHCHITGDDSEAVHNVRFGEAAALACTDCHGADSMLALAGALEEEPDGVALLVGTANNKLLQETGYLIGANRILGLDILMILLVLGACCFPVFHGGLRILFGRAR